MKTTLHFSSCECLPETSLTVGPNLDAEDVILSIRLLNLQHAR